MTVNPLTKPTAGFSKLPQSFITEVLARTDIANVVGRHVELRKQGANLLGLCPFHGEKSPSFTVAPQKQFYHCFGCGQNGDAIAFLREFAGLSFREAALELAQEVGLRPPDAAPQTPAPETASLYRVNEAAAAFYGHCLAKDKPTLAYLESRRLPPDAPKRFLIGSAPEAWTPLSEAFPDYASNKALVDTGLVIVKDDRRPYDRFRARLMFGIRDARGRVVGFGGRTMGDDPGPKYLNSSESAVFDKSTCLFGVFEAREGIRQTRQVLVVEGYMDCAALSMAGITQTVATMGTACTSSHIERLTALAPETVFAFDGDTAGRKAAWKSLLTCLPFATDGHHFRFLLLPSGLDPDELIIKEGGDAFRARISSALSLSAFLIQHLSEQHNMLAAAEDRAAFAKSATALTYQMPEGGRLATIIRQEILAATGLSRPSAQNRPSPRALPSAVGNRKVAGPWAALTRAIQLQPMTAAAAAASIVQVIDAALQDAFFGEDWDKFPQEQRDFWRGLQQAIIADGKGQAVDQEAGDAELMREMLLGAHRIISAETQRAARARRTLDFRSGALSEEEMLAAALQSRSRSPTQG